VYRWSQHRIILETLGIALLPNITKLQAHIVVVVEVVVVAAAVVAVVIFERNQYVSSAYRL
jgi:hypothetical protein